MHSTHTSWYRVDLNTSFFLSLSLVYIIKYFELNSMKLAASSSSIPPINNNNNNHHHHNNTHAICLQNVLTPFNIYARSSIVKWKYWHAAAHMWNRCAVLSERVNGTKEDSSNSTAALYAIHKHTHVFYFDLFFRCCCCGSDLMPVCTFKKNAVCAREYILALVLT